MPKIFWVAGILSICGVFICTTALVIPGDQPALSFGGLFLSITGLILSAIGILEED